MNIHTIPLATHQALREALLKEKQIRLLGTNSSEKDFQEAMCNFKTRLEARGYPKNLIESTLTGLLCRTAVGAQKANQTD